jgi:hypothetical protein
MLLAAVLMLSACQSGSFSKQGASNPATVSGAAASPLPAMARTRFSDVPLPEGIKEDIERSYVYESATLQVGRMVYEVDTRSTNLAQFYISEAPKLGWQLTSMLLAEGAQMMFQKPGKEMWVNVSPKGMMSKNARLVIHVVPTETATHARVENLGSPR